MKKASVFLLVFLGILLGVTACEKQSSTVSEPTPARQTVELTVWGAEEDIQLLQELVSSFQAHYAAEADVRITCQPQSESNCKDILLGDLEAGADVFTFADDQVAALAAAGALDMLLVTIGYNTATMMWGVFALLTAGGLTERLGGQIGLLLGLGLAVFGLLDVAMFLFLFLPGPARKLLYGCIALGAKVYPDSIKP